MAVKCGFGVLGKILPIGLMLVSDRLAGFRVLNWGCLGLGLRRTHGLLSHGGLCVANTTGNIHQIKCIRPTSQQTAKEKGSLVRLKTAHHTSRKLLEGWAWNLSQTALEPQWGEMQTYVARLGCQTKQRA